MKKILALLLFVIVAVSCSLDDGGNDFQFEFLPIESVVMPDSLSMNERNQITVKYLRPTSCHGFYNISFSRDSQLQRTVAVVNTKATNRTDCEDLTDDLQEFTFDFIAIYNEPYTFRFWQGKNADGENQFLIMERPVN